MAIRDIIPWSRGRELTATRGNDYNPFLALRQEMDRLFDDTFRGFGLTPFGLGDRFQPRRGLRLRSRIPERR